MKMNSLVTKSNFNDWLEHADQSKIYLLSEYIKSNPFNQFLLDSGVHLMYPVHDQITYITVYRNFPTTFDYKTPKWMKVLMMAFYGYLLFNEKESYDLNTFKHFMSQRKDFL